MPYTIPNPTRPAALRPVALITDRAKRYRAQRNIQQSAKVCIYCGRGPRAAGPLMVDHIDGREINGAPENLAYACRSCNTQKGAYFARQGAGTRTRQYNPRRAGSKPRGIRSLAQFIKAISTVKGDSAQMDLFEASELLKATPADERSRWAKEANARRWGARGTVPF